jgi:outer membrane protein assembly complex protein YaeT
MNYNNIAAMKAEKTEETSRFGRPFARKGFFYEFACMMGLFCFWMVLDPLTACADFEEFFVQSVTFKGVESVSQKELAKTLAIRSFRWWRFWDHRDPAASEDLEDDLTRIRIFYQERGYYHAEAAYETHIQPREKKVPSSNKSLPVVKVVYTVFEGSPAIIAHIGLSIEPMIESHTEKDLLELLPVKTGQIFQTTDYRRSKRLITSTLGDRGYAFPTIDGRVKVHMATDRVHIFFDIHPGEKYAFGPLTVSGPKDYVKKHVLERAIRFQQGDVYRQDRIAESQRNLYGVDIFKAAVIKPQGPVSESSEIPMKLEFKPKKKRGVKLGVGYGSEDGFRVKGSWTYRNVFQRAGKLALSAKRSDITENAELEYSQPYIVDAKTHLRTQAGVQRDILQSYTTRNIYGRAAVDRNLAQDWIGTIAYNLEMNHVEDLSISAGEVQDIGTHDNYLISSVEFAATYNSTDDNFNPKSGNIIFLSYEQASGLFGSEANFLSPRLELKQYQPLCKSVSLAGRIRMQSIMETEDSTDLPIFKRLFLGGSDTVRGYAYQELPPLDSDEKPIGGLSLLNANVELRYPLYKKISGIVFLDMGHLDLDAFNCDIEDMRFSTGGGIRYDTVVGPIRVDLGYKLNPPTRGDIGYTTDTNKAIGDRWRLHFSIGHAF